MTDYGNPTTINPGYCPQEFQSCHHIIELLRRKQHELQMLTSIVSLRIFFAMQHVLQKWSLAAGWTMTAPKSVQKRISALEEEWCQYISRLGNRHSRGVVSIGAARSVIEQDSGERAGSSWLPKIGLQSNLSTWKFY